MTAYFLSKPSDDCMAVVRAGSLSGLSQDGPEISERIMDALPALCAAGAVVLFHQGDVVYSLRRHSAWVGIVDLFARPGCSIHDVIRVGREATSWAEANTYYHKLEARSPLTAMTVMARRLGWRVEGHRIASFRMPDGEMVNEYEVGTQLRRAPPWQQQH